MRGPGETRAGEDLQDTGEAGLDRMRAERGLHGLGKGRARDASRVGEANWKGADGAKELCDLGEAVSRWRTGPGRRCLGRRRRRRRSLLARQGCLDGHLRRWRLT